MNLNNFTLKAQEAVQKAFNIANAKGQQAIECAHLLHGVISEAESITDWLFGKIGVSSSAVLKDIEKLIETYPRVSGGETYMSSGAAEALRKANDQASAMKDKFVTTEHILMGILDTTDKASQILKDYGVTMKDLKAAGYTVTF